jgi:hypothetical protein
MNPSVFKAFLTHTLYLLSVALFIVNTTLAQNRTEVSGYVYDASGAVISGAFVAIKQNGKHIKETKTGNDGIYQIGNLLPGEYQLVVKASGFAIQERTISLTAESVTINTSKDNLRVDNASTATRINAPLMDIPQSIQVVPHELIEDQGVIRPAEAVRNVSSVVRKPAYLGLTDSYAVRGFNAPIGLWNGFRRDHYYSFTDISTVERREV